MWASAAQAQYVQRFKDIKNGAVTFTGNTLGLDGASGENGQGTRGAIGTFITTDTSLRDSNPLPATAPQFPFGTTSDWRQNGSLAVLRFKSGARVLRAELIWGGTFAGNDAADNVSAFIDNAIVFTTPSGTFEVTPDPATAKTSGTPAGTGTCSSCFYVRTANVTAMVTGPGTYGAGRVPATQGTTDNNNPVAGWTLAVVYEDFLQPIRSLTLFLGLEQSGGNAAQVAGFCTPPSGTTLSGRLAVSAIEGDARITGDEMRFGPTSTLGSTTRVSGARNPEDNFFSGQILDDEGNLDTEGTFGLLNHTAGEPVAGARQGWDITNVNVSTQLRNNQTTAFARGTTDGDSYRIAALALQIDVGAPRFGSADAKSVDRATALVGDVLTYTVLLDNSKGTTSATNVVFFDTPPAGTSFVPNSFTINGVAQAGANPVSGVPLGTIAGGATVTVRFQARVDSIPAGPNPHLRSNRARWTFNFVSCAGQPTQAGANETNTVVTEVPVADLSVTKTLVNPPATAGAPVAYQVVVRNNGPSAVSGATVSDPGTSPALTGVTWTCVVPPLGGTCAPTGTGPLSTTVGLAPGASATFTVTGALSPGTPPGTVLTNTATVTAPTTVPDPNPANNTASAASTTAGSADVRITKAGPSTGQRGANVTYTVSVINDGPSDAQNVLVTDPAPSGLTLVSITGACGVAPGCLLPAGATQTVTVVFAIPPAYAGADPIVNTANVASSTPDPVPANNTATATTALDAPVAELSVTKTNGVTQITAGLDTTYTITVSNAGPASALATRVVDLFDPAFFANPRWQCVASGTSVCRTTGAQTGNIDALIDINPGPGNVVVFTVQVLVRPELAPQAETTNTVTITPPAGVSDANSANNAATDTDTVVTAGDVGVTKTGPTTVVPGTTVEYTIVVTNNGPSVATGVVVGDVMFAPGGADVFPELLAGVVAPPGIECPDLPVFSEITGEEFTTPLCTIPSLPPLESRTFTWRFAIPPDFPGSPDQSTPALENVVNAFVDPAFDNEQGNNFALVPIVVTPQADVAITKIGPAAIVAGLQVSYFIRVSNNGASTATNVVVEDPIPAGLTLVGAEGPCAGGFPCTIAALAPGEGNTTRIDLLVPADYAGPPTFVNTATARSDVPDANTANNSASVSTLVAPEQADLAVTITGPTVVAPGAVIEYVARVVNLGPGPASNVTFSAIIPGGTTSVGETVPPPPTTCTVPPPGTANLVSCLTPLLPVGGFVDFVIRVQTSPDLVAGSSLTIVGGVSSPTPDFNPNNDRTEVITRIAGTNEADLSVEKTDSPDPVIAGADVTYTITIRNAGPGTATNVAFTDTLPGGFTLVSALPSQGSCAGAACSLGALAPSASATVTLVATTSATGIFTNVATVAATEPDPVSANNTVSQPTTVATADQADLVIAKLGPAVLKPGDSSFYAIVIVNRGPAPALNVRVVDSLPAGLTLVGNAGACVTPFPCEFDVLQPGQSVIIDTAFTVAAGLPTPATVVNTASVESPFTPDPDLSNNSSATTTQILPNPSADLAVVKRDSPDPVVAGTTFSYTLTLANRGPSAASDVTLTDVLPPGVTVISANSTQGTCTGTTTITCQIGTMPGGSLVNVGVLATAPLNLPAPNPMINSVSVAGSGPPDPDPANNAATELTTVLPPVADLSVTKTLTTAAIPGLPAAYTIVVTNSGPSAIAGASLVDAFPGPLAAVTWTCVATPGSSCGTASGAGALATTVDLQNGGMATFVATGTIASSAIGVLANTVTVAVSAGASDPNPANNSAVSSVTLTPQADLQLVKSGPAQATAGTPVTFTLTVTNAGPSDAVDVTLADPAPSGLTFVAGGGACAAFPCALGTVPAGATVSATATFAVPAGYTTPDPIANVATVSSASTPDPASGNNSATAMSAIAAPVTDLGITKTNGVATAVPGSAVTYTITVSNAGPSNAIGATVTDVFPAALTGVTWTCAGVGGGTCSVPAGSGNINTTVNVPFGATVTFTATGTVAPDATGVLVNTATVTPPPGASDPSSANNTDADELTPQVDLAITKVGPVSIVIGDRLVYTITVTNNGPSNAEGVVVTDPLPPGLTFESNTGDCTTPFPCAVGNLPAGATRTITATFTVPPGYAGPAPIVNVADVSSTTPDTNTANNTATVGTTLNTDADVEVTKSVPASGVRVGDAIAVTIDVRNRGPNPATGVEITDTLPAGLQFVSASATQGGYDEATGRWTVGSLALDATAQLIINATVTSPGSITNLAVKTGQNEPDPNTGNDSAAATTNAAPSADIAIEKAVDRGDALVGETVTFTVRATNRGPSPATGVTIADALPAGLSVVSATPSQGAYVAATGIWTVGSLGALAEATLTLVATVGAPGALVNNAAVASQDQIDPNPLNNSDAASVNAAPNADLRIAKAVSNLAPGVGAFVTYTIAVTNVGPSQATSAEILDQLPAGVTFVSAIPSQGTYEPSTGLWTLGTLPVSGTETLSITGQITELGVVANVATRQSSAPVDPNPANDSGAATSTASIVADLAVTKTASAPAVAAGMPLTWTIVVTNNGPSSALDAPVADTFPAAVTGITWTCTASSGSTCGAPGGMGAIGTTVSLSSQGTATFQVTGTVSPSATGGLLNTASAAAPTGTTDPDSTNNSATSSVAVTTSGDAQITMTGPSVVTRGATAIFTITLTNAGPSTTAGVTLDVPTPPGLVLAGLAGCPGLPCSLPGLVPGESRVVTVSFTVPATYAGPEVIATTATIASATADPTPANNTATHMLTVSAGADLSIVKTGPVSVVRGSTVTYTLTIRNTGSSSADAVMVDDPAPAGLTFVSNSGDCTTPFPCAVGTVATGGTRTITATFEVQRSPAATSSIVNTANVSSSTADPTPADNSATAVTEVRAARVGCDVNGDGMDEIVTGAGPGGAPHVRVVSLASGSELASFYAYDVLFGGGVFVACGDVNGDGLADIITGAGPGGGPHVRAFSLAGGGISEIASFFAYDPAFGGGVRVAVADVDGDALADIITGAGPGGGPHVRAFSLATGVSEIASFYAYAPAFAGGVFVAGGDLNGDGLAEIITGTTRAGGPVRVFQIEPTGVTELLNFFAYFPAFPGPVRVAAADVNGDGVADIITGAGPGGGPHVQAFSLSGGVLTVLASFYAYDPAWCDGSFDDPIVCDGVFVAGGDVTGEGTAEIITGTNRAGGPVRVFQIGPGGVTELANFFPYFPPFLGPVRVAEADPPRDRPAGSVVVWSSPLQPDREKSDRRVGSRADGAKNGRGLALQSRAPGSAPIHATGRSPPRHHLNSVSPTDSSWRPHEVSRSPRQTNENPSWALSLVLFVYPTVGGACYDLPFPRAFNSATVRSQ